MKLKYVKRSDYYIKWKISFNVDKKYRAYHILPTIVYQPWKYRGPNVSIIDIAWLNFHILIGEWRNKER